MAAVALACGRRRPTSARRPRRSPHRLAANQPGRRLAQQQAASEEAPALHAAPAAQVHGARSRFGLPAGVVGRSGWELLPGLVKGARVEGRALREGEHLLLACSPRGAQWLQSALGMQRLNTDCKI